MNVAQALGDHGPLDEANQLEFWDLLKLLVIEFHLRQAFTTTTPLKADADFTIPQRVIRVHYSQGPLFRRSAILKLYYSH